MDQKKVTQLPPLSTTLVAPDPEDAASTTLELDELWSFVLKKANQIWVWIALCRKTRQVIAYALGDRSKHTCQRLWEAIPSTYRKGHCFTDFWAAYQLLTTGAKYFHVGIAESLYRSTPVIWPKVIEGNTHPATFRWKHLVEEVMKTVLERD